jgi:trehalose/maltose hydrolase-like predicted phosphorylase
MLLTRSLGSGGGDWMFVCAFCCAQVIVLWMAFCSPMAMVAQAAHRAHPQADEDWTLSTSDFDNRFEAEPYVGDGYLGQRIPAAGMGYLGDLGHVGWPLGTERIASSIAAGVYAKVADGRFYKEEKQAIALIPTWSTLTFATPSGVYSPATVSKNEVIGYNQSLDLRTGVVTTSGTWVSPTGQRTRFRYRVSTDRARKHLAVVTLDLVPLWTGEAIVSSVLDGAGARRIDPVDDGVDLATQTIHVTSRAKGTGILVAEASTLQFSKVNGVTSSALKSDVAQTAGERVVFEVEAGKSYSFTKYVAVVTGRDSQTPSSDALAESMQAASRGLIALLEENKVAWASVWESEVLVSGDRSLQQAIRSSEYSLYASIRSDSPASIGPAGLSSDGYAGMVFWDADTWMFPVLLAQHPEIARVMVDYRYDTLAAARRNAANNGYQGAFYPWTSGTTGDMGDECYGAVTDSHGKVVSDPNKSCTQEFHLQADIALAQWQYYEATGDKRWLEERGWPVLEAVAQFWTSKATAVNGGYSLLQVQTPDEYAVDTNNDSYTNAAASLALERAIEAAKVLGKTAPPMWDEVGRGLISTMPVDKAKNIYLEHDGYDGRQIKQADVAMLTYPLDFSMPKSFGINDLNYYTPRTDGNGPAMTDAIHSIAASAVDVPGCSAYTYMIRSYQPFLRKPFLQFSEFAPEKLSDTTYDFLTGVGGFVQEFLYGFSGFRPLTDAIHLDPSLPPQLSGITLRNMAWQGRIFTIQIGPKTTNVTLVSGSALPVETKDGKKIVQSGKVLILPTRRPDLQPTGDLARCQSIAASSSLAANPPVGAIDGIPATAWTAAEPKAALTVTLASPTWLRKITVHRGSPGLFSYSVEASLDGLQWKTIGAAPAKSAGIDEFTATQMRAKFVRLKFQGDKGADAPSITEFSVMTK